DYYCMVWHDNAYWVF
nr:immunoglobulin light chain junction region [Macaca mulatta]